MFTGDRLRQAIEAVVRAMAPDPVGLGAWPATVSGWDDGAQLAELATPDGSPLPRVLRNVPLLVDPPGTMVSLPVGTPVLVAFRGASYAQPQPLALARGRLAQWRSVALLAPQLARQGLRWRGRGTVLALGCSS